jgi:hypothetical protein
MWALAIETERLGRIYKPRKHNRDETKARVALTDVSLSIPRPWFLSQWAADSPGRDSQSA